LTTTVARTTPTWREPGFWPAPLLPIGDLWLAAGAGAPTATLARHAVIGGVLLAAWTFLSRWASRTARH
jgi:hypothetical protein